jgi:prepilin-type N-terminal cleavage/methylation domain-containing protein
MIAPGTMKRACKTHINQRGFTMIEMVAVLIVLAIFSTVALSTYRTITNKLMAEMDGLKVSLRFAQIQALAESQFNADTDTWGIHFPDSTTYRLYKNNVDASSQMIPVKGSDDDPVTAGCPINCHKLSKNVLIPQSVVGKTINFDKWGRPLDGATLLGADFSIVLDLNEPSKTVTITMNTGYIP